MLDAGERYRSTLKGRVSVLYRTTLQRSASLGLAHDITREWIEEKLKGVCEVSGLPFVFTVPGAGNRGWARVGDWSPSIDRINPTLGYTTDNCQMVVWMYNRAKNQSSDESVMLLARALVAQNDRG